MSPVSVVQLRAHKIWTFEFCIMVVKEPLFSCKNMNAYKLRPIADVTKNF